MVLPPEHPQGVEMGAKAEAAVKKEIAEVMARAKAKASRKGHRGQGQPTVSRDSLKPINLNAGGLDIGAEEIWACVPEGRDEVSVRLFQTFTIDLYALADWLEAGGVETVAMESTGVYWIPIYEILEARGVEVYLVNARHVKSVTGRKTDILDCQWVQQLHTYGLLQASFRPAEQIAALRAYVRHRGNLIQARGTHIQHMQKALMQMNVQLTTVLSDITGETGMKIIRAIVTGERDPLKLAQFRDPRCANSEATIAKALQGNDRPEHVFVLKQALELYDFYTEQIKACDEALERSYAAFTPQVDLEDNPLPPCSRKKRANEPAFDLRTYLYQMTAIPGLTWSWETFPENCLITSQSGHY